MKVRASSRKKAFFVLSSNLMTKEQRENIKKYLEEQFNAVQLLEEYAEDLTQNETKKEQYKESNTSTLTKTFPELDEDLINELQKDIDFELKTLSEMEKNKIAKKLKQNEETLKFENQKMKVQYREKMKRTSEKLALISQVTKETQNMFIEKKESQKSTQDTISSQRAPWKIDFTKKDLMPGLEQEFKKFSQK